MRKKLIFIFALFIVNLMPLYAESSISCPSIVEDKEYIKCSVTVDTEPVLILSDKLDVKEILESNNYSKKSSKSVLFNESGSVTFGPAKLDDKEYLISAYDESGNIKIGSSYPVTVKEKEIAATTEKTTTTTTTTAKAASNNNYLVSIKVNNEDIINFDKDKTKYTLEYDYEVEKVTISAKTEEDTASVEISGNKELKVGENVFTLTVSAEDLSTRVYKIIINREDKKEFNTKLEDINVVGYDLNFNSQSKTFYLKVDKDVKSLKIKAITEDSNAKVKITGNKNLENESIIKITVTNETEESTYRIIIEKDVKDNSIWFLLGIGIVLLIIIFILLKLFISNKKKDNRDKKREKQKESKKKDNLVEVINEDDDIDNDLEKTKVIDMAIEEIYDDEDTKVFEIEENKD